MTTYINKKSLAYILTEGLNLGVVVVDADYRIVLWNGWMEKQSGIKDKDVLGQNIFDKCPDIKERKKGQYISRCIENGHPFLLSSYFHEYLIPINMVKADKTIRMLQNVKIYPLISEKALSCAIIIEDVTNQVLHENEILRLNRVLKGIRNVNQLITRVNSEKELFNETCKILIEDIGYVLTWIGLTEEGSFDVKPVAFAGIEPGLFEELKVKWDDSEYGLGVTGRAIKTEKLQQVDSIQKDLLSKPWHDFAKKAGYQSTCSLPLKVDGRVVGAINVCSREKTVFHGEELELLKEVTGDISFAVASLRERRKRRLAEEALRDSEEKYRAMMEAMKDLVYICSPDYRIKYMNPAMLRSIGRDATGELCFKALHDLEEKCPWCVHNKIRQGDCFDQDIVSPMNNRHYHITSSPIVRRDGSTSKMTVFRDTTDFKKMEAQLRQAQKMEAIGVLAGGIAHDFNNLLTVIIGNAQLALLNVVKDESLRMEIEEIKSAGDKAVSLTRQLLAFSRKQIIEPVVLDLNEEINETEKMLKRMIRENIEFQTFLEPELWKVYADQGQIDQVIMNMVLNARDAMPRNGKLTIETANADLDENYFLEHGIEEAPGHYVMLAVSDTGSGMDKKTREQIFDPFFTTKEVGKGTGLGLSTVYGIVKQNNGFVWVYSEPGKGTTFKIYLPKVKEDTKPEEKEQTPVEDLGGFETILIVEDNEGLRKFAQKSLLMHGYRVLNAENGEDALRVSQAHEGQIDLMITDVVMPKMGGKKLAERLQPLYPQMKVIYMSGYTDNAVVRHGVLEPGLNFIPKPFTPENLARKVREVLDAEN